MKKSLGQNFLVNKKVIKEFIEFSKPSSSDNVIEIGVGEGALTLPLSERVGHITGVEIDQELVGKISNFQLDNFELINKDFLNLNLRSLIKKKKVNKIFGSIPYNISSPIIHKIIEEAAEPLKEVYISTQYEFANKVLGKDEKRSYFTNLIEKYATLIKGKKISKSAYKPAPKVDSLYFGFRFNTYPSSTKEVKEWENFLHHVFKSPRKMINKRFKPKTLKKAGVDPKKRPANIGLSELEKIKKYY